MKKSATSKLWRLLAIALLAAVAMPSMAATKRKPVKDADAGQIHTTAPMRQLGNVPLRMLAKPATQAGLLTAAPTQYAGPMRRLGEAPKRLTDVPQRTDSIPVIYGAVTYDPSNSHYGMISVDKGVITDVREHEALTAAYGGVYAGGLYYNTYAEIGGGQVGALEAYLWDTKNNWRMIAYTYDATIDMIALALTADPVSETVYGIFYNPEGNGGEFGTLDIKNFKRSGTISTFDFSKIMPMSMSCDAKGTLWMIDDKGILYTIDKHTGALTKKAETGLACPYATDGAIDIDSDIYYYLPLDGENPEGWNLYAIDLANDFKVEKCYNLPIELGGMFIMNEPKEQAPGMPVNVSVEFPEGSLTGKVKFGAPSRLMDGTQKVGNVNWTVVFNDETMATGTTIYGGDVEAEITVPAIGRYDVRVYASNDEGMGPRTAPVTVWIGEGKPLQVKNLSGYLDRATGKVGLTWDAATSAELGGYLVPADVTYTITRYTDGQNPVVVSKNQKVPAFAEQLPVPAKMEGYSYEVVANYKSQTSEPALSKVLAMGIIYPPYENDFASAFATEYFDFLDANADGYALKYEDYYGALGMYNNNMRPQATADEWAFSQPMHLEKGKVYTVTMMAYSNSGNNGLQICTGTEATPEAMTDVWFEERPLTDCRYAAKQITCTIRPAATGNYVVGLHVTGSAATWRSVYFNNFTVSEPFGAYAPNVVTDVVFVPPFENTPTAEIKFKAPVKTVVGGTLTSITRIDVERDGKLVKTFNNPTFGSELSFIDEAPELGDYTYTFTGYNEYGTGYHYTTEGHVGIFLAKPPVNCHIEQYTDAWGSVKVTWEPVYEDMNGYPINPQWVQYVIGSGAGANFKAIVEGVNPDDREISLDLVRPNSGQALVSLTFVPVTPYGGFLGKYNGMSLNSTTNQIFVGTPFECPYLESFASETLNHSMVQTNQYWRIARATTTQAGTVESQDGDNGFMYWQPYQGPGSYTTLETANIQLDDADDIALSFYYDAVPGHPAYDFYPYILCEGDTVQASYALNTGDAAIDGWNHVQISLAKWRGKVIRLGFFVHCIDYYGFFCIDNIQIRRFPANDLAVKTLNVPKEVAVGDSAVVSAQVRNEGYAASGASKVELYRDGKLMASKDVAALEPYTDTMVAFDVAPTNFWGKRPRFSAKVVWDADELDFNNEWADTAFNVIQTKLPAVLELTGTYAEADSSVFVTWYEPDYAPKVIDVTEDCEELDPFNFTNLGSFSTYDGKDYSDDPTIWGDYPGSDEPHAWFVMENDPEDSDKRQEWWITAHSGIKSFASYDATVVSDDWLISPLLPGTAQTINFFAATGEDYGSEYIEVLYSTKSKDIADFVKIGDTIEVEEGEYDDDDNWITKWNEFSVELPEGALYFAIRNVSDNIWSVYVDDISFQQSTEKLELKGYNVYRNGEKLNEQLVTERQWSDVSLEPATYTYHVEAIYDKGIAPLSQPYEVTVTPVLGIADAAGAAVSVVGGQGVIFINGAEGCDYIISNAQGIIVAQGTGSETVAAHPGVYMAKVAGKAFKVVVK